MLSSPIILYDHPEVAPESTGDLFDSTEIDEILLLRTMTLTDEEKREVRGTDARAAAILDRIDDMPAEMFERLHGAIRYARVVPSEVPPALEAEAEHATVVRPRRRRLVRPDHGHRADRERRRGERHPRACCGRATGPTRRTCSSSTAPRRCRACSTIVDDEVHVAVVLDDDPFAELQQWQRRFYYFRPDELEVVG